MSSSPREEAASTGGNKNDDEGHNSGIILSNDEILSMTMNSTRSLRTSTAEATDMSPPQHNIDSSQQDDLERRQQQGIAKSDTPNIDAVVKHDEAEVVSPSGEGRVITLSNDEVLDITGRESIVSTRDSIASLTATTTTKKKKRESTGIVTSTSSPVRSSTHISPTKNTDIATLKKQVMLSTPALEPPVTPPLAGKEMLNAARPMGASKTAVTGVRTASTLISSSSKQKSPIVGLEEKKQNEKITDSSFRSSSLQRPLTPPYRQRRSRRPGSRSTSNSPIREGRDTSYKGSVRINHNAPDGGNTPPPPIVEPVHPGAVRVAGFGKTNAKDSIISLMAGNATEEDDKSDEADTSSKFMATSRKDSTNTAPSDTKSIRESIEYQDKKSVDDINTTSNYNGPVTAKAISQEELEKEVLQKFNLQGYTTTTDVEQPQQTLQAPPAAAAMAVLVTKEEINYMSNKNRRWWIWGSILLAIIVIVVVVVVVVAIGNGASGDDGASELQQHDSHDDDHHDGHDDHDSHDGHDNDHSIGLPTEPTLQRIQDRGYLKCRVEPKDVYVGHGLSVELCAAISAAIFGVAGESDHADHEHDHSHDGQQLFYEFVEMPFEEQFDALSHGTIDIITASTTHTMERDIAEPFSSHGYTFSDPYFYTGTVFAGSPEYVTCAENGDSLVGVCRDLQVCIVSGSNSESVVHDHLKGSTIHHVPQSEDLFINLTNGTCNVITGLPKIVYEEQARKAGFSGEYVVGSQLFSRDPVSLVTRNDDPEFGDFVNWVLRALVVAEAINITQDTANSFPDTEWFGEKYKHMFRNAIVAVGNYGEMYNHYLNSTVPRVIGGINSPHLTKDDGGLLYPIPFGALSAGDGDHDHDGHDHDYSSFGPIPNGTLDTTYKSHVLRCGIIVGGDRKGLADYNNETEEWSGMDVDYCRGLTATVFAGEVTAESLVLMPYQSSADGFVALAANEIDILSGATYTMENDVLEPATGQGFAFGSIYYYDSGGLDDDGTTFVYPLSMATRQDDCQWSDFVRLMIVATIHAEATGVTQGTAIDMPTLDLFGPMYQQALRDMVLHVGNYAEIYKRNMELYIPRSNNTRNTLNNGETPMFFPNWKF